MCLQMLAEPAAIGQEWARGELAVWLHRLGHDVSAHAAGAADPYALELAGDLTGAADAWRDLGAPFEDALCRAQSLDADDARNAVDALDRLGADATADKIRSALRAAGVVSVPSRRRAATRANA